MDQSRTLAVTSVYREARMWVLVRILRWRFGAIEGRSVRVTDAVGRMAEAARPTRPVPAPSSRTRRFGGQ